MISFLTLFPDAFFSLFLLELYPSTLEVSTDLIIAIAGYVIAVALLFTVRRRHPDLPLQGVLGLWALSFGALGTLHLLASLPTGWVTEKFASLTEALTALTVFCAAIASVAKLPGFLTVTALDQASHTRPSAGSDGQADEAIVQEITQPLKQQVLSCNQELEQVQSTQNSLLQREQNVRGELEVALENLQDTAERLNIALSAAKMGTWEWNLETQQQYWSAQAKLILGFEADATDLTYDHWMQRIYPEDLPRVEAAIAQAKQHHTIFSEEYRIQLPDQPLRWVLSQGRFVFSLEGHPRRIIGVIQETTQKKQASLALRASEVRFRAVFEQAAVGMARLSVEGTWMQVNSTLCQLLGYPDDELLGKHFQDLTDPADLTQDEHYYQQLIQSEVESCRYEKRYLHQDGTPVWVMMTLSIERDEDGNIVSLIAVVEDIRKLKQARMDLEHRAEELERVNSLLAMTNAMLEKRHAELDQFAYVASHDLKAPLRAIANLSEWIEEDLGDQLPEENQHQLSLLRNRVHRMEALINGLLEYSRVGRRQKQIVEVDVKQLIADAIDFLSPPESFTFEIPDEELTLTTNRTALRQVLYNLIGNAVKHHDREDGRVEITVQDQGDRLEFVVSDDGPGIAPEYHDKVFTIFQTLKSRDELESTGIGLSLVKKIIESEGGTLRLESALGEGATFRFTWPKQ